jgi:Arabinose-binding domain of AraC transcription regulator, N-term
MQILPPKPKTTPAAATPMAFARAVALAYERRGMDPSEALALAQITPAQLRRPQGRITAPQMEALCGHAMRELDDEALGWFSRRLPWGSYFMLARVNHVTHSKAGAQALVQASPVVD